MELKKSRESKGTKNLQLAEDGTYTLRTTEINHFQFLCLSLTFYIENENGDEVEVVKTITPVEGAGSQIMLYAPG